MSEDGLTFSGLRDRAVELWGFPSGTSDEAELLEAFMRHPQAVARALEHVIGRMSSANPPRFPWRVWLLECRNVSGVDAVAPAQDRGRDIGRALAWITRAGCYLPSADELLDELLGERGNLRYLADDPVVRAQLVEAWEKARPAALELEAEAERRGAEARERDREAAGLRRLQRAAA